MANLSAKTGFTPVQTRILLANNAATSVQNFSAYDAQELTGFVFVDAATDYRASVKIQIVKNGMGVYEVAAADIAGDDIGGSPIVSFSISGTSLVATLPNFTGFVTAYIQYNLNAPALGGQFPLSIDASNVVNLSSAVPTGSVMMHAGIVEPNGWLLCYGQAVSRTTYAALFASLSTTYGVGDGSTTFNLPDLRGRSAFGKDNMGGVAANRVTAGISGIAATTLGAVGGDQALHGHVHPAGTLSVGTALAGSISGADLSHSHSGTTASMSSSGYSGNHNHDINGAGIVGISATGSGPTAQFLWQSTPYGTGSYNLDHAHNFSTGGASVSMNHGHGHSLSLSSGAVSNSTATQGNGSSQNMPPAIILNFIIKT